METEAASPTLPPFTPTPETAAIAMAEHLRAGNEVRLNGNHVEAMSKFMCQGSYDKVEVTFYPDHTVVHRHYEDKSEQGTGEDLEYMARIPGVLTPVALTPLLQALDAARLGMRPGIY